MIRLRSFLQLKNSPVYSETNQLLGTVEDLIVLKKGKTLGFRIDKNNIFLRDCFVPVTSIIHISEEKIQVLQKNLLPLDMVPNSVFYLNNWINKRLVGEDHHLIGLLKDVYFTSNLGMIEMIEITEGWFSDLKEGRKYCFFRDITYEDGKENRFLVRRGGLLDEMPKLSEQKFR